MSEYGERPFRKPGTNTAAGRAKKVEKTKNQVASAQAKRAMVVYALERMERLGITKKQAFAMVKQAVRKGELEGPAPSQSSFYRMMSKAEQMDGLPNVKAFIARQKDGRPPHEWHPDLEARFLQMVRSGAYKGPAAICRDLRPWAEERGFDPLPTVWTVRRHWENLDVAEIAAAVHGARAAVADAIPHGTVPVTYTHELWTVGSTHFALSGRATVASHRDTRWVHGRSLRSTSASSRT